MSRPLLIILLTILVNLIGFGIIIPLLPFYATTFGASPLVVGLLFASFSLAQFVAAPILGDLSDRWGRRPVLVFSLLGTVLSFTLLALAHSLTLLFIARIVDGLSGGNITAARAYIADVTPPEDRAKRYGLIGAAFGLGFILGPALGGALSHISYTAPIWAAVALSAIAAVLAYAWLPAPARHAADAGAPPWWRTLPELIARPGLGSLLLVDFLYWSTFAVYQTTFALYGQRRFGWDATHIGYILASFGLLGVVIQTHVVGPVTRALGDRRTLVVGLGCATTGLAVGSLAGSIPVFVLGLVPTALGMGLCNPTLTALISRSVGPAEQGLVQGAAGALESLGRTGGPIWGNVVLEHYGEGTTYGAAAVAFAATLVLAAGSRPTER